MTTDDKAASPKTASSIIAAKDGESSGRAMARAVLNPSIQAAVTIQEFEKSKTDLGGYMEELTAQAEAVNEGDLSRAEAILITQAHTLNNVFNNLIRRAGKQENLKNLETCMRLAFKAQGQCRATLETLANIKNPPVVYARQANISHGHQQINNGAPGTHPHAEKIVNAQNELLEVQYGSEKMDTGATGAAIGTDPAMATVGKIHRG